MNDPDALVDRRRDIQENLEAVQRRMAAACASANRDPNDVTLIVVTKTRPASDVALVSELGVTDVGENREPEASRKHAECEELPLTWHFIGQLQRNKTGKVARYADVVQSLDRSELITAMSSAAERAERNLRGLVQVDLTDGAEGRGGASPQDVLTLCEEIVAATNLDLAGLMAVAPLDEDPGAAFERLHALHQRVLKDFPEATMLSAGMSGDLEMAVLAGATHVRIGSAVLGERQHVR